MPVRMLNNRAQAGALMGTLRADWLPHLLAALGAVVLGLVAAVGVQVLGPLALVVAVAIPLAVTAVLDVRFALALVLLSITVLGSELRVGPIRVVDALILLGLFGLVLHLSPSAQRPHIARLGSAQAAALLMLLALMISVVGAVVRDTAAYHLRPDLHAVAIPIGIFFLIRAVLRREGGSEWLLGLLTIAILLASLKAGFLSVVGTSIVDGPTSLLQAYVFTESLGTKRVVLVGADTLIALGPAVLIAARHIDLLRNKRWIAGLVLTGLAVAASGTRTNIVIGIVSIVAALGLELAAVPANRARMVRVMFGVLSGAALLLVAATLIPAGGQPIAKGISVRFNNQALENSSKVFREAEQQRLVEALQGNEMLGLGAGGTYFTQTSPYTWEQTLWAHNGFLWVALKVGVVGLAAFVAGLLLLLLGLWRRRGVVLARIALILTLGTFALSITTNRLTDAGAAVILALAFAVLSTLPDSEPT